MAAHAEGAPAQAWSDDQGPLVAGSVDNSPTASMEALLFASYKSERSHSDSTVLLPVQLGETPTSRSFSIDARSFVPERKDSSISRRYEIHSHEIGVGGYGRVYAAKDRMFKDRRVAIKKLTRQTEEELETLRQEVAIMKELDHPSICKLFETYLQDQSFFFVIELLEGGDLCDLIMEQHHCGEGTAAYIIKQTAGALCYAHSHGIAHRDMKPENVCFCSKDPANHRVKVIDWGLSKHFAQARMKSSVGSGAFTAPEVIDPPPEAAGYTSACDLWSLGVMTYVLLCGKPPFWGKLQKMLQCMQQEQYPMSGSLWEGVPDAAKDFIATLLKCNPEERLPARGLLVHPWLARQFVNLDEDVFTQVLSNVEQFSHAPDFLSICVASMARQLDHRTLDNCYRVFCTLDTNSNGVIEVQELREGFAAVFGRDSQEVAEVEETFARLDLDQTGMLTYTEFCAAGIGESSYTQEHILWAAFKTFDLDDRGYVTAEDIRQVLSQADVHQVWSEQVCRDVAQEVALHFGNADGSIDFEEWLSLMRTCATQHTEESPKRRASGKDSPH